jgi:hypothetical protein
MMVIFPVFGKANLLPYFLRYYTSIGATRFLCALYQGEKNPLYEQIFSYEANYELKVVASTHCARSRFSSIPEAVGLNKIRERFLKSRDWYCMADLDEFHYFGGASLLEVSREAQRRGYSAVHGRFVDRITKDGSLPPIGGVLDERFPLGCNLTACIGLNCNKIMLARSHVIINPGHHNTRAKTWQDITQVHHFKWNRGVAEDIDDRYRRYKSQGMSWVERVYPKTCRMVKNGIDLNMPMLNKWPAAKLGI